MEVAAHARRREELAEAYKKEQEAIKAELLEVTYSYHDPNPDRNGFKGHRNSVTIPKGFTMQEFLNKCREQVKELRKDPRFKQLIDRFDEPLLNENAMKVLKGMFGRK